MDNIEFEVISNKEDIKATMLLFKDDIYNKSISIDMLEQLAQKFSSYANFVVIKQADNLIGYIAFYTNDTVEHIGFISMIIVSSCYQGMGYGSKLIGKAIAICKSESIRELRLKVDSSNSRAIKFYKKIGFNEIKKENSDILMSINIIQ